MVLYWWGQTPLGGELWGRGTPAPLSSAAYEGNFLLIWQMYDHILEIEREVYWIYGNVTCAAYPLEDIDTISATGEINTKSAMYHVVYGVGRPLCVGGYVCGR